MSAMIDFSDVTFSQICAAQIFRVGKRLDNGFAKVIP